MRGIDTILSQSSITEDYSCDDIFFRALDAARDILIRELPGRVFDIKISECDENRME